MSMYTIEDCYLYKDSITIANIPIYIFNDHNLALPAWGICSSRLGRPLNLITFDSHSDTHFSFHSYVVDQTGEAANCRHLGLNNPKIRELLKGIHYQVDDFCFEDVYKITVGHLKNDEQILAGMDLGYLSSYTVITKEAETGAGFEHDDRMLGYDAKYLSKECWDQGKIDTIADPLVVDFDLDFFGAALDFDKDFMSKITPLIKRARAITIAKEPDFFELCRTDKSYTNEQALSQLLYYLNEALAN